MNEFPERLLADQAGIERLAQLCVELDDEERVRLHFDDGTVRSGVVAVRPTVQVFRDGDGREGYNALLRLEPLSGDGPPHYLWLDRLREVVRLGSD